MKVTALKNFAKIVKMDDYILFIADFTCKYTFSIIYVHHQSQREELKEVFGQLETDNLYTNAEDIKSAKRIFRQCIQTSKWRIFYRKTLLSGDYIQHRTTTKGISTNWEWMDSLFYTGRRNLCRYASGYLQICLHSAGEQMEFFAPMLERSLFKALCQDITPNNTALRAKKCSMQRYGWKMESGIIQIGMEPRRLLRNWKKRSLPDIISKCHWKQTDIYILSKQKYQKKYCFYRRKFNRNRSEQ